MRGTRRAAGLAAVLLLLGSGGARGATLVYEGFNGYSDITATTAPNANTIGLDQATPYAGNSPENLSIATGLTLSNLEVSGGSASFSAGTIVAGAQIDRASPYTGTLYSSYLVQLTSRGSANANGAEVRISNDDATGGNRFRSMADSRTNANTKVLAVSYDGSQADASTEISLDTTYIIIGRFTNVGTALSAATPGVATSWALTAAQFDNFRTAADPEAFLDAAPIGGGPTEVTARAADAPVTTGTFSFADGNRMQFVEVGDAGLVDEIRYGTSLADVTVPEPAALGLIGAAGLLLLRRRSSSTIPQR
jgi:hypothetical protein